MWLLLAAVAFAGDVRGSRPDETIIVEDTRAEAQALANLEQAIKENGYFQVTIGGVHRFVPWRVWRPNVTVRESGDVRIGARTLTLMHWGSGTLDGVQGGPRTARTQESQLRETLGPWIEAWESARLSRGQHERENVVRVSLDRLWSDGIGFHRETLATWEQRRCAITEFHDTRTETPEGRAVQSIVTGFVETVVQHSSEPYAVGTGCPQPG
jgi:hypothetical protein